MWGRKNSQFVCVCPATVSVCLCECTWSCIIPLGSLTDPQCPPPPHPSSPLPPISPIASPLLALLPRLVATAPLWLKARGRRDAAASSVGCRYGDGHMGLRWRSGAMRGWDRGRGDVVTSRASEMHQSEYGRRHYATLQCHIVVLHPDKLSNASFFLSIYHIYSVKEHIHLHSIHSSTNKQI